MDKKGYNISEYYFINTGENMTVKNKIKTLRIQFNITQNQMAKELGVTRQTIIAVENNYYNPSLELALKISKFFKTNVENIFTLE